MPFEEIHQYGNTYEQVQLSNTSLIWLLPLLCYCPSICSCLPALHITNTFSASLMLKVWRDRGHTIVPLFSLAICWSAWKEKVLCDNMKSLVKHLAYVRTDEEERVWQYSLERLVSREWHITWILVTLKAKFNELFSFNKGQNHLSSSTALNIYVWSFSLRGRCLKHLGRKN